MIRAAVATVMVLAMTIWGAVLANDDPGEHVFQQCDTCHSITDDDAGMTGPNLAGIVGRAAGSHPGFAYSDPLTTAGKHGLVWTPEALDVYLSVPHGSSIGFPGLPDPADRAAVIAYLTKLGAGP
jgi:cytochrome c